METKTLDIDDQELRAMAEVFRILSDLDQPTRTRVLSWVSSRLALSEHGHKGSKK